MEPILDPKNYRDYLFPIQYQDIWDIRQKHKASFWTAEELDLVTDLSDWKNKLNDDERYFIKQVLAFFAKSDFIVNENLAKDFSDRIQIPEFQFYYSIQMFMETEHSLVYAQLIDTYINDPIEKQAMFKAAETIPTIKKKSNWAYNWIKNGTFQQRLVAFAIMEGIFFSGSFCAIFWLKKRGLMHGLTISNEFISRDEGIHRDLACLIYRKYIVNKLPEEELLQIVKEAVEIEKEFVTSALPVKLIGMNSVLMGQYIEYVADHLLVEMIGKRLYKVDNPFTWMTMISLDSKTNFFESRPSQYSKNLNTEENSINFKTSF
jgi:ribonucleoside-diphosphate reductase beta chain